MTTSSKNVALLWTEDTMSLLEFHSMQIKRSYKLHCPALLNMLIIDRTGQCNFVSPSYLASTHDITIYRGHQLESYDSLKQMIQTVKPGEEPYIHADSGYNGHGAPEIVTHPNDHFTTRKIFSKCRILVEQYFGRMASKFASSRMPFRFKEGLHDYYLKAVSFLTNFFFEPTPLW